MPPFVRVGQNESGRASRVRHEIARSVREGLVIAGLARTGILRGLACRCPNCGKARLFTRYITVRSPCPECSIDNTIFASDDLPPYLTIAVVGHLVVPAFLWFDARYLPELWIEALIWLPLSVALSLALLPSMKGASIGMAWASGTVSQETSVSDDKPCRTEARTPRQ